MPAEPPDPTRAKLCRHIENPPPLGEALRSGVGL